MRRLLLLAATPLICACAGVTLEPDPPPGFDLTGQWVLQADASEVAPTRRRLRANGGMLAFVTQDFPVLRATAMSIEQSADSMGIRYDTGDYRDVSWGTRQRGLWEVRAGWNEGDLLILSEASDAQASETLTLTNEGRRLEVAIAVKAGSGDVKLTRVFLRAAE